VSAAGARRVVLGMVAALAACSGSPTKAPAPVSGVPLTARILEPNGEITVLAGSVFSLKAAFDQGALEVDPDTVVWRSSLQGELARATAADGVVLGAGEHVVTADASLGTSSGSAHTKVTAAYVGARILRPQDGAHLRPAAAIALGAAGVGLEGGTSVQLVSSTTPGPAQRTAHFVWSSSLDGYLGAGDTVRVGSLSPGRHRITLDLLYDDVARGTVSGGAAVEVVVDTPPAVSIDAPACDGSAMVEVGAVQVLSASASDAEDGALTGGFVDLLTGDTHAGDSWELASSVVGEHPIEFEATDALGERASVVCPVLVVPAGGGLAEVFPPLDAINAALPAGGDVRFVGGDGEGRLLVGVVGGLVVVDAAGTPSGLYGAAELGLGGTPTVGGAVASSGRVLLGTASGVVECTWLDGVPSGCGSVDVHSSTAVALDGDLAGSGMVAAASPLGLLVGSVAGGALTTTFFPRSLMSTGGSVYGVAFAGGSLFVATGGGLCVIRAPLALLSSGASTIACDEVVTQATSVLSTSALRALAAASGMLWIGTLDGLGRYDLGTGKTAHLGVEAGLADVLVEAVSVDSAGILWVGTAGGLNRVDPRTLRVMTLRLPEWSGSPEVRSVHVERGRVWLGTATGVVAYTVD
jgi:hypothetical protein